MRVLVVTAPLPWDLTNGASLVLHHHLRIVARRHEITILGSGAPERERRLQGAAGGLPDGAAMRWFGTAVPGPLDYALRRVKSVWSREPAHVHWVERPALLRAFQDELKKQPAIVHLHGWGTAGLSRLLARTPAVHVPIDAWSLGVGNRAQRPWRERLERSQLGKITAHERRHYPNCRTVVTVAEHDAAYLRRLVPRARVAVVPNGVDAGPEPGPPSSEPVVGFHGAFENVANRDAALFLARKVFPAVRSSRPDAKLLLIGRDPPPEILELAGDGVEVTGSVPDVRAALGGVAVYAAPMVSGTGMKNKVLEAMAASLPVVATRSAVSGIGAGDGVRLADEAPGLADEIIDLLASPEARAAEGAAGRRRVVSEFTWEKSAAAIERLWDEAAE